MGVKPAAVAALVATAFVSAPSNADDIIQPQLNTPTTMFYVSIPLGASTAKERAPSYGLALQGKRQYEMVMLDSRMLNFAEGLLAGIEAKWLIAGVLVAGAGVYAVSQDRKRSDNYSSSQNQQQNNNPPPPPPPVNCTDPCKN
jgi:hypothetical protein